MTACGLVDDLMDRSKVGAVAPGMRFVRDPADCEGADLVVVDLGRHAGTVAALRSLLPDARIVAFGRHDNPEALAAAAAAGADLVLPRSRFFLDPRAALTP
jgi:DNA-binding NarL/FixJ family response regulator